MEPIYKYDDGSHVSENDEKKGHGEIENDSICEGAEVTAESITTSAKPSDEVSEPNAGAGKDNPDREMEESLRRMMQLETPTLNVVKDIFLLPSRLLLSRFALLIVAHIMLPAFYLDGLLVYAGALIGSLVAGDSVEFIKSIIKSSSELKVINKLADIFEREGLRIHSFNKGESIPLFLLSHSHLAEGFNGYVGGDLISLHYRDYSAVCSNIALTQTPVEGFEDSYTQDDVQARKHFKIEDRQSVVFYGSVFMFFPGPDIEGNVRLSAFSPEDYLRDLKKVNMEKFSTKPDKLQQRMEYFHKYHQIEGDNDETGPGADRVFTQRVKDMILQLEWQKRAPITVYADKNMVCLTIQDKVYDLECIHDLADPGDEVSADLYGKIASFKTILDTIIGPEGSEYTELMGNPTDYRKSAYTSFLNPFHELTSLEDDDIRVYVRHLAEWSADIYRFLLHCSHVYRVTCKNMTYVSRMFLTAFFENEQPAQVKMWLKSEAGKELKESLTGAAVELFRELWNAPGKCEVRNISGKRDDEGKITFDIVVNPPIRKWNYLEETNRHVVLKCKSSRFGMHSLNDKNMQKELVDTFRKNLRALNSLSYDVDHIYPATITLNEGRKYGMAPEEISKFCVWYSDLMAANMEKNGVSFTLE